MLAKISIGNSKMLQWQSLIEHLQKAIDNNQYHHFFTLLRNSVQMICEEQLESIESEFPNQLKCILMVCNLLDEMACEKHYRDELAGVILIPLIHVLEVQKTDQYSTTVKNHIRKHLPFVSFGSIPYNNLCAHQAMSWDDYLLRNHKCPYQLLNDLRENYLRYIQDNSEQYEEAALVTRVIDYWRVLKSTSFRDFGLSDIHPLLHLSESVLTFAQETTQDSKRIELQRMVVLLQMLLHDHPSIKTLNFSHWPRYGFVYSLKFLELPQEHEVVLLPPSPLLKDYKPWLQKSREVFTREGIDVLEAQQTHTTLIIEMLREMILASSDVLGNPPCAIAICALGSTSRYDRRPYSDLELLVLHAEPDKAHGEEERRRWEAHVTVYIYHLISLLELMIVRLGETPNFKTRVEKHEAGFHLDSSCHVLLKDCKQRMKWGTPKQIVERYFIETEVANQKEDTHLWMDDANFQALLYPVLLHPGKLAGDALLRVYQDCLIHYLNTTISVNDRPDFILARFKLKTDCLAGLTRRQGIALVCQADILNKSASILRVKEQGKIKFRVGDKVNIKDAYAKPLSYCVINLQLYFNWLNASPLRQIEHYTQSLSWGGGTIFRWWKAALTYVAEHQAKLHLQSGHQEEEVMYVPGENADFFAGIDLIYRGFIYPLKKHIQQCQEGLARFEHVGYAILISYLNVRDHWVRNWVKKGIDRGSLLNHPLIQVLSTYPDVSGWSPMMVLTLQRHIHALASLSQPNTSACQFTGLPGNQSVVYFREDLVASCFNVKGEFKGDPELSGESSEVKRVNGEQSWFIKVKAGNEKGLMGREYLAMMLHLLLGGEPQVALGWPIKLRYRNNVVSKRVCAWLSEGIGGESLADVMRNSPQKLRKENMDIESFSQLFLLSFLTCPEDGQPENIRVLEREGKTQLIAIDYGQCFVQAERMQKLYFRKTTQVLTIKTMIYLLESMDEPLSSDTITRMRILNINKWFQDAFQSVNRRYNPLEEKDLPLIKLENEVLACIKTRLELLQHWVRTTQKAITGNNILMDLEPIVALQYQSMRAQIKTPEDFYTKLDPEAYKPNAKGKMVSSTTYALIKERTITPQHLVRSCDLEPSYFRNINFRHLNDNQQYYTLMLFESVAQTKGKNFFKLNLSGCRVISQDRLIGLLEKMTCLEVLDLQDCPKIYAVTLCEMFSHRPHATILTYDYDVLCPDLKLVKFTLDGKERVLQLRLGRLARQKLTTDLREFLKSRQQFREVIVYTLNKFNGEGYFPEELNYLVALKYLGEPKTLEIFMKLMESHNCYVREFFTKSLGKLGFLTEMFLRTQLEKKEDDNTVFFGLIGLGVEIANIRRALLKAIGDDDIRVRLAAVQAIGKLSCWDEETLRVMLKTAEDYSSRVRVAVAEAFGNLGHWDEGILRTLLKMTKESDVSVRAFALESLRKLSLGDEEKCKALLMATGIDSRSLTQTDRASILSKLAVQDKGWSIQRNIIFALLDIGSCDEQFRKDLHNAIGDRYSWVCAEALQLLVFLGSQYDEIFTDTCKKHIENQMNGVEQMPSNPKVKSGFWCKETHLSLLKRHKFHLAGFFTSPACINQIEYYMKSLPTDDASPLSYSEGDKILKHIFFFANDISTRKIIPCVSRKWRSVYQEFTDERCLHMAPKIRLSPNISEINDNGAVRSAGNSNIPLESMRKKF